jgi:NAD(P)-dependent dehydrogenase (short-subunit alcohol dehydrogenase family)
VVHNAKCIFVYHRTCLSEAGSWRENARLIKENSAGYGCKQRHRPRDRPAGQAAATKLRAENLDVHPVELDLNRKETIEAAASAIKAHGQRLDVLINNAAIVDPADGPPGTVDFGVVQRVMETNFFGTLSVTQAMLPLLREAPAPRIVNVSSGLGSLTMNGDPTWSFAGAKFLGYNTSKAALNMLTIQ